MKLKKSTKKDDDEDILDIFRKFKVNIPLLDAIQQVPRYAKLLKQLCTNKKRLQGKLNVGATVSVVLQKHLPPKCKDPGLGVDDQILVYSINGIPLFDRTCEDASEALEVLSQAIAPPSWKKRQEKDKLGEDFLRNPTRKPSAHQVFEKISRRVRARASTSQVPPNEEDNAAQPFLDVPPPIFVDNDCREWYGTRYNNSFIIEKVLPTNVDQELGVSQLFVNRGWESLQVDGYYYPNLVKQFYANMDKDRDGHEYIINTMVKGKYIVVDEEFLCQLFGLNNDGSMFYFTCTDGEQNTATEGTWKRDDALQIFDIPLGMDNQGNREVKVKYMEPRDRLVCYLLHHNVIPRSSNKHKLRIEEFYVVDKLCHELGRCDGIPMLGVEVDGEIDFNNEGNVINVNCLSHLGIKRRVIANHSHWCNVHRRTHEQGQEQPHVEVPPPLEVNGEENFQELPMR
ncbi:hypothetical protein CCACVL1_05702 [Corchorus capsularis]|uniref:Uncharacterized protein n=1 Tax=Corchorus capsularis TaxID=210143 RepID=A0A1R3JJC0_COCAP|nr:hypothetical protein CCACVL1_05702 [Corchorus capsularis]